MDDARIQNGPAFGGFVGQALQGVFGHARVVFQKQSLDILRRRRSA